jgi:G3E family GTPase
VVILNKVADATPPQVDAARKIIRSLNADAKIIETSHSDVPADAILDTGLFDFDKAHEHPLWAKELYGFANHVPEDEEYGVESFVYHARRPFVPEKILAVLQGALPNVVRAKGHFWIATRPDWVIEFSLAGAMSSAKPLGRWWASVPEERLPTHPEAQAEIARQWAEPWGDRRQEMVFIGVGLDREAICAQLNAALIEGDDFEPLAWADLPDPFPAWRAV